MKKILLFGIILFPLIFSCKKFSEEIKSTPENITPMISPNIKDGQYINGTILFKAEILNDIDIPVTKIEFYFNNTLVSTKTSAPYEYSLNTTAVSDGQYSFEVKAYYNSGDIGSYSKKLTINNTASDILPPNTALNVTEGQIINGPINITATTTDNIAVAKVEFYIDNVLKSTDTTTPYEYNWDSTSVSDGSHEIKVIAYDNANNSSNDIKNIIASNNDATNPTITIDSITEGQPVSGIINVTATANDNIVISKVEFYVENILKSTDTTAPYEYSWDSTSVADGSREIKAIAYDGSNNTATDIKNVIASNNDVTNPTITIDSITEGQTVSGTINITTTANDNLAIGKVEFYIDNTLVFTDNTTPYEYNWNSASVADGSREIKTIAYDGANNTATDIKNVIATNNDATNPTVSINTPTEGQDVNGTLNITATANDNLIVTKVEFYIDNILKSTDTTAPYEYSWDTTAVADGSREIKAIAYDGANNTANNIKNVNVDNTIPTTSINVITEGQYVKSTVNITATASDNDTVAKVEFYIDNVLKSTDTTAPYEYSWDTTAIADGAREIKVIAYDNINNTANDIKNVNVDNTIPTTSINIITEGQYVKGSLNITATANDNLAVSKVEFYIDNVLKSTDTTTTYEYSWDTTVVSNGSYEIKVIAYDNINNTATHIRNVNVDNTNPSLDTSGIPEGSSWNGTFAIVATVSDNVGIDKVEFYIDNVLEFTDTAFTYMYIYDSTAVSDGSHAIKVIVYDTAGNTTTHIKNVNIDNTPPTISIDSVTEGQTVNLEVNIATTASDNDTIAKVEFYINNVLKSTDTTAPYDYNWDSTAVSDGSHEIKAIAHDEAGNTTSVIKNVNVNNIYEIKNTTINDSNPISLVVNTALDNGKYAVAYVNTSDSKAYYAVYNTDGSIVKAPTVFLVGVPTDIAITTLANNEFVISFIYTGNLYLRIYESDGTVTSKFANLSGSATNVSLVPLDSGNRFVVAFNDGQGRIYNIESSTASTICNFTFDSSVVSDISLAHADSETDVVIYYKKSGNVYYRIYDGSGPSFLFVTNGAGGIPLNTNISATTLPNDSNVVAFNGMVDASTTITVDTNATEMSITALDSGNIAVVYKDGAGKGQFSIYTPAGTKIVGPLEFGVNPQYMNISKLSTGWLVVSFSDLNNSNYATSIVYGPQ